MATKRDPLKNLRDQVRKRRGAVTAKENRIKRNTGVDVRGTDQDPRLPIAAVTKMNRRELTEYLAALNGFMSRSIGFTAGQEGSPIPISLWREYQKLEKQYNAIGAQKFDLIKDIKIDFAGLTIAEREARMYADSKANRNDVIHRPFGHVERKASNIKNKEALIKLMDGLEKKLSHDYEKFELDKGRDQLRMMLASMNYDSAEFDALSDYQFNLLWNYTGFATAIATISPSGSKRDKAAKGLSKRAEDKVSEDIGGDIQQYIDWAKKLPKTEDEQKDIRAKNNRAKKPRRRKKG